MYVAVTLPFRADLIKADVTPKLSRTCFVRRMLWAVRLWFWYSWEMKSAILRARLFSSFAVRNLSLFTWSIRNSL